MCRLFLLPLLLLLIACSDQAQTQAIEAQLAGLRIKPQGQIETLPRFPETVKATYTHLPTRDPFFPVKNLTSNHLISNHLTNRLEPLGPDLNRPPSALEKWDLAQLSFRGSMQRGKSISGLVITPDKQLVSVKKGDHIGKNHGIITHLDKKSITLVEIIPSGSEWQKREKIINLSR